MAPLHHLLGGNDHVVAEIIEPEFVVRAVGNVFAVLDATLVSVHVLQDAANGQSKEFEDLPHPLAVAKGEIIVDSDEVDAST